MFGLEPIDLWKAEWAVFKQQWATHDIVLKRFFNDIDKTSWQVLLPKRRSCRHIIGTSLVYYSHKKSKFGIHVSFPLKPVLSSLVSDNKYKIIPLSAYIYDLSKSSVWIKKSTENQLKNNGLLYQNVNITNIKNAINMPPNGINENYQRYILTIISIIAY